MKIQNINSYNQRSNVNFRATAGDFGELSKVLNGKGIIDAERELTALCGGSPKKGIVDLIIATSKFMEKTPDGKEVEVSKHMAAFKYREDESQQISVNRLIPNGLSYKDTVEILKGLIKSVL